MKTKILILEDDPILLETLQDEFESIGYLVDIAKHGNEALEKTYNAKYDIYIFDIQVPYINGLSILDELRKSSDKTPTILLTSKNSDEDKIRGFQKGCDDYITKPFSLQELQYRIKAILNRTKKQSEPISIDNITVDLKKNIFQIDGNDIQIDKKTLEILHLFITNNNTLFSYEDI
ncbi:MAG: response regulator transcription factor, partial [Campylobacterales bacterium]|nr:response regulator transcription factor [Campylobacterales bacterium]